MAPGAEICFRGNPSYAATGTAESLGHNWIRNSASGLFLTYCHHPSQILESDIVYCRGRVTSVVSDSLCRAVPLTECYQYRPGQSFPSASSTPKQLRDGKHHHTRRKWPITGNKPPRMNRTSRTDEPYGGEGLNQSPSPLSADLTTNADFSGRADKRELRTEDATDTTRTGRENVPEPSGDSVDHGIEQRILGGVLANDATRKGQFGEKGGRGSSRTSETAKTAFHKAKHAFLTFGRFIGPGFMISVAYSEFPVGDAGTYTHLL